MSRLLTDELREALPRLREQDGSADPVVCAIFLFPLSGWKWFATEGEQRGDDFVFFGFVTGLESEWGYFSLSELEGVDINGMMVRRDEKFKSSRISECIAHYLGSL